MKFTQVRFLCNVQRHSLNQVEYFVGKIKKYKENNLSPKFDFFTGWSNHVRWQGRLNSLEEASTSSLGFKSNKENWWSANSSSLLSACQININHVQWLLWIFEIIQTWISYNSANLLESWFIHHFFYCFWFPYKLVCLWVLEKNSPHNSAISTFISLSVQTKLASYYMKMVSSKFIQLVRTLFLKFIQYTNTWYYYRFT